MLTGPLDVSVFTTSSSDSTVKAEVWCQLLLLKTLSLTCAPPPPSPRLSVYYRISCWRLVPVDNKSYIFTEKQDISACCVWWQRQTSLCPCVTLPSIVAQLTAERWGFPPADWWQWSSPRRNLWAPDCAEPRTPAETQQNFSQWGSESSTIRHTTPTHTRYVMCYSWCNTVQWKQQPKHIMFCCS